MSCDQPLFVFILTNAAFLLNGFDDQARNLMLMKTNFPVLKLKFLPVWSLFTN